MPVERRRRGWARWVALAALATANFPAAASGADTPVYYDPETDSYNTTPAPSEGAWRSPSGNLVCRVEDADTLDRRPGNRLTMKVRCTSRLDRRTAVLEVTDIGARRAYVRAATGPEMSRPGRVLGYGKRTTLYALSYEPEYDLRVIEEMRCTSSRGGMLCQSRGGHFVSIFVAVGRAEVRR